MTSTAQSTAAAPHTHETADMMIQKMSVLAQAKPAIINSSSMHQYSNGSPEPDELVASELSDNLNAALKLSRASQSELQLKTQADFLMRRSESANLSQHQYQQRLRAMHIDDATTIEKQNATNQMRQAAVMSALAAAAASQQQQQQQSKQQRLSATERLAMTARRPQTQQPAPQRANNLHLKQLNLPPPPAVPTHQHHSRSISQPATAQARSGANKPALDSKPVAAMPTLETLLAVQRQLQRHTRQNLTHNTTNQPQDLVNKQQQTNEMPEKQQVVTTTTTTNKTHEQEQYFSKQYPNLTSRLQPPVIEREQNNYVTASHLQQHHETYDKELPPLPASISPSSTYTTNTTDGESQMNSLESQSSPATSLISLPPPPPPLSSYLQQYDEVASSQNQRHQRPTKQQQQQQQQQQAGNGSIQSNASTPQTSCGSPLSAASYQDISPLRHSPVVPIKQQQQVCSTSTTTSASAQSTQPARQVAPPPLAPRPAHLNLNLPPKPLPSQLQPKQQGVTPPPPPPVAPDQLPSGFQTSNAHPSLPPPPPLPEAGPQPSAGLDQPDCASFRFPTPPPPEMLLDDMDDEDLEMMLMKKSVQFGGDGGNDDDDDDDDFQCRIPTPPSGSGQKSMSFVSFQDLNNCHQRPGANAAMQHEQRMSHFFASSAATTPDQQQQHRALFNSSSFAVPQQQNASATTASGEQQITAMQPPPLFRQVQPQQQQQLRPVESHQKQQQQWQNQQVKTGNRDTVKISAPQLTVRVNEQEEAAARLASANSSGLLSTAGGHLQHNQMANMHHHSFMMNTMVRSAVVSSSSPSSSSDGDGHSSNSSSSTSGVHSSIDSPSLKSESDFNYGASVAAAAPINKSHLMRAPANANATDIQLMKKPQAAAPHSRHQHKFLPQPHQHQQQQYVNTRELQHTTTRCLSVGQQRRNSSSSINSTSTITSGTGSVTGNQQQHPRQQQNKLPRPALKQKKSVSFSDRIELVACAEEQCEQHLPNPLLARVLAAATKSQ